VRPLHSQLSPRTDKRSLLSRYQERLRRDQNHVAAAGAELQRVTNIRLDALMHRIVDVSFDAIITTDVHGTIDICNSAAAEIFGMTVDALKGRPFSHIMPIYPGYIDEHSEHYAVGLGHRETIAIHSSGATFPIEASLSKTTFGEETVYVIIIRNISERRAQQEQLEYQAQHDMLTGLPNRTLLNQRTKEAVSVAEQNNGRLALMLLDLDRFKAVNDTLGHHVGDDLLREISKRLSDIVGPSDTIARLGGDEFAVLMPQIERLEDVQHLAEKLAQVFTDRFPLPDGLLLDVGCSIGIALYPDHSDDSARLMQCADVAMYAAKETSSDIVTYDAKKDYNSMRLLTLSGELRTSMQENMLAMEFQPKLDLNLRKITALEALCRWSHPILGNVKPFEFIAHAEQTGMIADLTSWSFNQTLLEMAKMREIGYDMQVAINLSGCMLHDQKITDLMRDLLKEHGVPGDRVIIEITESAFVIDPETAKKNANALQDLGLTLSIDDYGTGYSSLAYLQQLPLNELKIDRSFVHGMIHDNSSAVIVRSTIDLAHNLGLKIVAEGVENDEQIEFLAKLKCDMIQGYAIAAEMNTDDLCQWFQHSKWDVPDSFLLSNTHGD